MGPLAGFLAREALSLGHQAAGPVITQSLSDFRDAAGWNDIARARAVMYRQQYGSTRRQLSDNFTPLRMVPDQLIRIFNQWTWPQSDDQAGRRRWLRMQRQLKYAGIDMSLRDVIGGGSNYDQNSTPEAREWYRLIEMSCQAAPLENVLRDYWRGKSAIATPNMVDHAELDYNLQRGEFRRPEDRERLLNPYYDWTLQDILRLNWMGVIDIAETENLLASIGLRHGRDATFMTLLSRQIPNAQYLMQWDSRKLWNEHIAEWFGLDEGYERDSVAGFFSRVGGVGRQADPLPNQPDGETDWLKLAYRSSRTLPSYAEARVLQHRLRPAIEGSITAPDLATPTWTADSTKNLLRVQGYPEPIVEQLLAVVDEPINLRLVEMVLMPILEHPDIARLAERLFGQGDQWIVDMMLDHGFDAGTAELSAKAIRMQATDKFYADKTAHKKRLRDEGRAEIIKQYELGTILGDDAVPKMMDTQYSREMAKQELDLVDAAIKRGIVEAKVKELETAFMSGQQTIAQISQVMTGLNIRDDRRVQYLELWQWERNVNRRQLTTQEILAAAKSGIMTQQQATQRLVNLGWTNADAMVELQMVQHEMQIAQQKQAQTAAAKSQAQAATAKHAAVTAAAHAAALAKQQGAASAKMSREKQIATHAQLLDQSKYYAEVHHSNAAYAKAAKAGNEELKSAELEKQIAEYQQWLINQINIASEGPEVQREIGTLKTTPAPGPDTSQGASSNPATTSVPPGGTGSPSSGTTAPVGTGSPIPAGGSQPGGVSGNPASSGVAS